MQIAILENTVQYVFSALKKDEQNALSSITQNCMQSNPKHQFMFMTKMYKQGHYS